jgi:voltage-gated potassium channel
MSVEILITIPENEQIILDHIDLGICIIFLFDFFYHFFKSKNKFKYFKQNWLDLVSSIPFAWILRYFRILRIIKLIRLMKIFKGIKGLNYIIKWLGDDKFRNMLISMLMIFCLVLFYASLIFYSVEKGINPNVHNFFDAVWWAFISVTSVGYGDIYPVTTTGRIVAILLIIFGMSIFSIITAKIASHYMKEKN